MIKLGNYADKDYSFPRHDIDPEQKKSKEYALSFSRAFYSMWLRGDTLYGWADRVKFLGLRKLAVGKQPDDLYYELCYGRDKQGEIIRKGYMNVNWDILKVAPKYRNAFVGMFTDIDYEIQATSLSPFSTKEKEEKKWGMWVQQKIMPKVGINEAAVGIESPIPQMPETELPMVPETISELNVMDSLGFFKLKEELAYEQFLKATFDVISRYPLEIKDKILEDLWDLGRAVIKDFVDIPTQKIKVRYADVANCVLRRRSDQSILDGGEFRLMTIAELRAESDYSEDMLKEMAQGFLGYFGNMTQEEWNRNQGQQEYSGNFGLTYYYDGIRVLVLDCEYATVDDKYITEVKTDKGNRYYKEKFGKKRDSQKRKTIVQKQATYYRAKWIVGTEHVYDYGLQYDIPRPSKSEARCSFHYVELTTPSPVETISPVLHQVQLAWLKFQNAWAKAKPDGWAYDEGQLSNSVLGGKITVDQLVRMSEQTGRLFYKTVDPRNRAAVAPNAGPPIIPMGGGIGNAANEFVATWNLMIDMLQELSGITPQAAASPLPAKTGKGVSEIALGATNNVMKPMVNCYRNIKQMASYNVLLRGKIVFTTNQEIAKDYYEILGESTVQMLKENAKKTASQYGISLVPRINDAMRAKLEQAALDAMAVDRNGGVGIDYSEFLLIEQLLDQGANPKMIQGALNMFINRRKKSRDEQASAMAKQQSDGLIQMEMMKAEQNARAKVLESALKIREMEAGAIIEANKELGVQFVGNMMSEALQIAMGEMASPQPQDMGMGGMPPEMAMGGMMPPQEEVPVAPEEGGEMEEEVIEE